MFSFFSNLSCREWQPLCCPDWQPLLWTFTWIINSTILIFFNKWLLVSSIPIDPLTLITFHMLCCTGFCIFALYKGWIEYPFLMPGEDTNTGDKSDNPCKVPMTPTLDGEREPLLHSPFVSLEVDSQGSGRSISGRTNSEDLVIKSPATPETPNSEREAVSSQEVDENSSQISVVVEGNNSDETADLSTTEPSEDTASEFSGISSGKKKFSNSDSKFGKPTIGKIKNFNKDATKSTLADDSCTNDITDTETETVLSPLLSKDDDLSLDTIVASKSTSFSAYLTRDFLYFHVSTFGVVSLMFFLGLLGGNAAYLFAPVGFLQIPKACTPVAVYIGACLLNMEKFTWKTMFSIVITIAGVVIAVRRNDKTIDKHAVKAVGTGSSTKTATEEGVKVGGDMVIDAITIGIILQFLVALTDTTRMLMVNLLLISKKKAQQMMGNRDSNNDSENPSESTVDNFPLRSPNEGISAFQMTLCVSPLCLGWCFFLLGVQSTGLFDLFPSRNGTSPQSKEDHITSNSNPGQKFLASDSNSAAVTASVIFLSLFPALCLILNGFVAVSMNVVTYQTIKRAGPILLVFAGIMKDIIIVVIDMLIWGTVFSLTQCGGILLTVGGIAAFSYLKIKGNESEKSGAVVDDSIWMNSLKGFVGICMLGAVGCWTAPMVGLVH